jgi:hypothetical protein
MRDMAGPLFIWLGMAILSVRALVSPVLADERLFDVIQNNYSVVHRAGYAEIEECTPDKLVTIGDLIFVCSGYHYVYHYGEAVIVGKSFAHGGKNFTAMLLCLPDEEECFAGQAYQR